MLETMQCDPMYDVEKKNASHIPEKLLDRLCPDCAKIFKNLSFSLAQVCSENMQSMAMHKISLKTMSDNKITSYFSSIFPESCKMCVMCSFALVFARSFNLSTEQQHYFDPCAFSIRPSSHT